MLGLKDILVSRLNMAIYKFCDGINFKCFKTTVEKLGYVKKLLGFYFWEGRHESSRSHLQGACVFKTAK